jgi:hypothetical protein
MYLLKHELKCEEHFPSLIFLLGPSVIGLARNFERRQLMALVLHGVFFLAGFREFLSTQIEFLVYTRVEVSGFPQTAML